jgi:hypothetical protein
MSICYADAQRGYRVKERPAVKARYGPIGHGVSGDVHGGKAWRSLRRPSDMVSRLDALMGAIELSVVADVRMSMPISSERYGPRRSSVAKPAGRSS